MSKESRREERLTRELGTCKHFNGLINNCCDVGVAYNAVKDRTVTPFGVPCLKHRGGNTTCASACYPTREEVEAEDAEAAASLGRTLKIREKIREKIVRVTAGARGVRGEFACPCCEGGTVRYRVAACNGHIAAACSTPGCARWVE